LQIENIDKTYQENENKFNVSIDETVKKLNKLRSDSLEDKTLKFFKKDIHSIDHSIQNPKTSKRNSSKIKDNLFYMDNNEEDQLKKSTKDEKEFETSEYNTSQNNSKISILIKPFNP
jgi:hypothetical protein